MTKSLKHEGSNLLGTKQLHLPTVGQEELDADTGGSGYEPDRTAASMHGLSTK